MARLVSCRARILRTGSYGILRQMGLQVGYNPLMGVWFEILCEAMDDSCCGYHRSIWISLGTEFQATGHGVESSRQRGGRGDSNVNFPVDQLGSVSDA